MINKNNYICINGEFVKEDEALININSGGFLYGDGLFETIRTYGNFEIFLDKHLDRLFNSLKFFKFPVDDYKKLRKTIKLETNKLIKLNNLENLDSYLKIVISRGKYKSKLDFSSTQEKNIIILVQDLNPYPEEMYKNGIKLIFSSIKRPLSGNFLYKHKMINYFENIYAKNEAILKNADEAIFLSENNYILEGSISNIFFVKNNKVITPSYKQNILLGITRQEIISICIENKIPIIEKKIKISELFDADEIFITNSIAEILPVKSIESYTPLKETPGPLTKKIAYLYKNKINFYKNNII